MLEKLAQLLSGLSGKLNNLSTRIRSYSTNCYLKEINEKWKSGDEITESDRKEFYKAKALYNAFKPHPEVIYEMNIINNKVSKASLECLKYLTY